MLFRNLKDEVIGYFSRRGKIAVIAVVFVCLIPALRLMYLQVIKYDELTRLSENNRIREMRIKPDRGFIKDRNGVLLVKNKPGYELELVKEDVKNVSDLLDNLSSVVLLDKAKVLRRLKQAYHYEPVKVTRGLNFEQISYLMEHSNDYQGIQFVADPARSYIDNLTLTHILGYISEVNEDDVNTLDGYQSGDTIGRRGIERQFEELLKGVDGTRRVEVDSFGRVTDVLNETLAIPGKNLILTIDYNLQHYISEVMDGNHGSVVVMDGKDNSILAMYSAPTYNLELFSPFITDVNWQKLLNDPAKPLLNRGIEGAYPPGSVFKILVALAGLKEGVITPETTFHCSGEFKATPRTTLVQHCWKRTGHGDVDLVKALSESCDIYFYNVGYLLGIDKLNEYARKFSLGELTGVELPNEKTGIFPNKEWKMARMKEPWYPGETVNVSIGQGYTTTTPLQMAVMTSSIFNGGNVYKPRIADAAEDPVTGEKTYFPPVLKSQVTVPAEMRDIIMKGLVHAVEDKGGTSWRGRVLGLRYGGKTGTAQVISLKRVENMKDEDIPDHWKDHSWYTGVYPAASPRYTIVVMKEHGGSGGKSSAPLASLIISRMLDLGYVGNN